MYIFLFRILVVATIGWVVAAQSPLTCSSNDTPPYNFRPVDSVLDLDESVNFLPLCYDLTSSNAPIANASNSWWTSSFVHGSDGHDYLVLSHLMEFTTIIYYRGSIYDITEKVYVQFGNYSNDASIFANSYDGALNVSIGDSFYFGSPLPGNATKQLRTISTVQDCQYDITFALSAPLLLNTGIGGYYGFGAAQTVEWSMPAGRTTGTLVRNGSTVTIEPDESFTWYDRQWTVASGSFIMPNWTWFELHMNNALNEKTDRVSLWIYDDVSKGRRQWATTNFEGGMNGVTAVHSFHSYGDTWTSSNTNVTYAQNWMVTLADGTELDIRSVYGDQEVGYPTTLVSYEGFVTVTAKSASGESVSGYGLVEVQPPLN